MGYVILFDAACSFWLDSCRVWGRGMLRAQSIAAYNPSITRMIMLPIHRFWLCGWVLADAVRRLTTALL